MITEISQEERYSLRAVDGWESFYNDTESFTPQSYLWDARRFSHKVYALLDAFKSKHRYVVWVDIDMTFKKPFAAKFFQRLVNGYCGAYLGRGRTYTETGCMIFDTEHEDFRAFEEKFRKFYDDRLIFELPYFIDCLAFDLSRKGLYFRDLTPDVEGMTSVFDKSPLGAIMDHAKGQGHGQYKRGAA